MTGFKIQGSFQNWPERKGLKVFFFLKTLSLLSIIITINNNNKLKVHRLSETNFRTYVLT